MNNTKNTTMTNNEATNPSHRELYAAKQALDAFLFNEPLHLLGFDRAVLEDQAERATPRHCAGQSIEQKCVNYLRHHGSVYDDLIRKLNRPSERFSSPVERHLLHVERRRCVAAVKKRILDEIAEKYPWLQAECVRQKDRDGVEDEPGEYVLPFGPFKGQPLRTIEADYLIRLLGQSFVRKQMRTRIERHLAERQAGGTSARF
jgi:hypothetical protein